MASVAVNMSKWACVVCVTQRSARSPFPSPDRHVTQKPYRLLCFSQTNTRVCVPVDNGRPPPGTSCSIHRAETTARPPNTHTHICRGLMLTSVHAYFLSPNVHATCTQFPHSLHFARREVRVWAGPGRAAIAYPGWGFISILKAWAVQGWVSQPLLPSDQPAPMCGTLGHACPFQ